MKNVRGSAPPAGRNVMARAPARNPLRSNHGQSQMENPSLEDAKPACGELEVERGHDRRVFPMPPGEAAALRLSKLRDVRRPAGYRTEGRARRPFASITDRSGRTAHASPASVIMDRIA